MLLRVGVVPAALACMVLAWASLTESVIHRGECRGAVPPRPTVR